MIGSAIIGFGYWGPNITRVLHENGRTQLKWCCDLDKRRLERFSKRYPGVATTGKLSDVLADDSTSVVCIATPISTHCELASQALERGKHVFVEKPLAASAK